VQASSGLNTASLAAGAARAALQASGVDPKAIELIVVGTTTPDVLWPATACLVQADLGLPMVASFDLYAAEASLLTAFDVAAHYMVSGAKAALVIGAEAANQLVDFPGQSGGRHPRAASAVVLGGGRQAGEVLATAAGGQATHDAAGNGLAQGTLKGLSRAVDDCLQRARLALKDIDVVIAEQTAPDLMRAWARAAGVPGDAFVLDPDAYADLYAAAPFAVLHDVVRQGRLKEGQTALLLACGSGPVWAAACLRWGSGGVVEW
jgi:3-oxoacyl-[acyl-carrier-protein] synthase-3